MGILAALMARNLSNQGQLVDVSMQDVMYFHNVPAMNAKITGSKSLFAQSGKTEEETQELRKRGIVFWNCYKTLDGFVAVVALTEKQWERFMKVIGREDLLKNPKFSNVLSRFSHSDEIRPIVEEWTGKRTKSEIVKILDDVKVPAGEVKDLDDVINDPQLQARNMFYKVKDKYQGELIVPGMPIKFSGAPEEISLAYPSLGEHNEEVYTQILEMTKNEIFELKKEGVI